MWGMGRCMIKVYTYEEFICLLEKDKPRINQTYLIAGRFDNQNLRKTLKHSKSFYQDLIGRVFYFD